MRRAAIAALALSLWSAGAASASAADDVDGTPLPLFADIALGDPMAKLQKFYFTDGGLPSCHRDSGVIEHLTCQYFAERDPKGLRRIAGVPYKILAFDYMKGRLIGFRTWIAADDYEALRAAVIKSYGPPSEEERTIIYDSDGDPLDQVMSLWKTPVGVLEMEEHSTIIDQSRLMLIVGKGQTEILRNAEPLPADGAEGGDRNQ